MVEHPVCDLDSCRLTVVACRSEVNASEDSSIPHFFKRVRETTERARNADHEVIVHDKMALLAKETRKHHCCRAADRRVA